MVLPTGRGSLTHPRLSEVKRVVLTTPVTWLLLLLRRFSLGLFLHLVEEGTEAVLGLGLSRCHWLTLHHTTWETTAHARLRLHLLLLHRLLLLHAGHHVSTLGSLSLHHHVLHHAHHPIHLVLHLVHAHLAISTTILHAASVRIHVLHLLLHHCHLLLHHHHLLLIAACTWLATHLTHARLAHLAHSWLSTHARMSHSHTHAALHTTLIVLLGGTRRIQFQQFLERIGRGSTSRGHILVSSHCGRLETLRDEALRLRLCSR